MCSHLVQILDEVLTNYWVHQKTQNLLEMKGYRPVGIGGT